MFRDLLDLDVLQFLLDALFRQGPVAGHAQLVGYFQLLVGRSGVRAPEIQGIALFRGHQEVILIVGDQLFVAAPQIKEFLQVFFFHVVNPMGCAPFLWRLNYLFYIVIDPSQEKKS